MLLTLQIMKTLQNVASLCDYDSANEDVKQGCVNVEESNKDNGLDSSSRVRLIYI